MNYIRSLAAPVTLRTSSGSTITIDPGKVKRFVRISAVLEGFGTLSSRWRDLVDAGFIPPSLSFAPTWAVPEMETIRQVLRSPYERLHFLHWRSALEELLLYSADELDLLALYVADQFPSLKSGINNRLQALGMGDLFHSYYMKIRYDPGVALAHRKLTPSWSELIKALEDQRTPRGSEVAHRLLCFNYRAQSRFESKLRRRSQARSGHAALTEPKRRPQMMSAMPLAGVEAIGIACHQTPRAEIIAEGSRASWLAAAAPNRAGLVLIDSTDENLSRVRQLFLSEEGETIVADLA